MNDMSEKIKKFESMVDEESALIDLNSGKEFVTHLRKYRLLVFAFTVSCYLVIAILMYSGFKLYGAFDEDYYISTYSGHTQKINQCEKNKCSAKGLVEE
ncbi:hypothetical protein DC914_RS25105 [Vibrio parahaemolyticus]|uniref:hypothetical protein n=1 Tax=Vibrio parahaemolyticus TaxID=670 RepID=UPI0006C2C1C7|nr:hypothetical protein [Vibrio parahaemolyticus]EGR5929836.1 hypothetical protein [Vibrio parahaemolyticus]EJG0181302.1 hypothetical protein [Vibrio parahaemolyticus]KOY40170.1 hypothetical protein ACX10_06925 [Vibrio parahaemolyticus]MCS0116627.1 hypothetical protein [Vibrio parahaemolyticus]